MQPLFGLFQKTITTFLTAVLIGTGCIAYGAEIATDPGDYAALPAGVDLGIMYYQHTERDKYYSNGKQLPGTVRLDTDIGLARWVHFTKIGDYVADPQIIIPFGSVKLKDGSAIGAPALSASGVGDPLVGGTLWLVNNPEQKKWFGVSAFASLPMGNYDQNKGPVNVGQNRWKGIFHAGYVAALSDQFILDVIGEYAVYGDNDKYAGAKLTQDASQSLQAHLRYVLSATSHLALSYYHDFGGETKINGVAQKDSMDNGRWLATYATFVAPTVQIQVQAGQSAKVDNGFKESSRLNLRIVKVF
ncbi:MAG: transporter [Rhodocyclaceae bacterium]|nr:MAG: transporter [Rhodocyclaceae bacterium]